MKPDKTHKINYEKIFENKQKKGFPFHLFSNMSLTHRVSTF